MYLVIGIIWLGLGLYYLFGRNQIHRQALRRRRGRVVPPMAFAVIGVIWILLGVISIVRAFL